MSKIKPLARKADIVVQEFSNELLIYDLNIDKAFALNETSSLVWQLCDGTRTISEITNLLSVKLNDLVTEDLVWLTLEQLKKENLLKNETINLTPFEGLSRREMIRKVGLASLVALPFISSLVAPTAVQAASSVCVVQGNLSCRCPCPATGVGSSCGQGAGGGVPNGLCNVNCTCTRIGAICPSAPGPISGTALGQCAP